MIANPNIAVVLDGGYLSESIYPCRLRLPAQWSTLFKHGITTLLRQLHHVKTTQNCLGPCHKCHPISPGHGKFFSSSFSKLLLASDAQLLRSEKRTPKTCVSPICHVNCQISSKVSTQSAVNDGATTANFFLDKSSKRVQL